jgi:hypothetical protein
MTDEELIKLWREDIKSHEEPFFDAKLVNEQLRKWSELIYNNTARPQFIVTSNPNGTNDFYSRMMRMQPPAPVEYINVSMQYDIFNSP